MKKLLLFAVAVLTTVASNAQTKQEVLGMIEKVNNHWQETHKAECRGFWDNAAYFTGNQAVYELTGKQQYLDYAVAWAEYNNWKGATQTDKSKWEYVTYGEDMNHVLFADWQICFQVYIDLYKLNKSEERLQRANEVMTYQAQTDKNDYWWWADALYMGFPIFSKLYTVTHDQKLLDKQYECFKWTDDLLFDQVAHLYYRDGKYVYPKVKTKCGEGRSFWARGDGWVLAGLAKVLNDIPKKCKYRKFYVQRFQQLAQAVAESQQPEGYWTRSMLCPDDAPGYETSGTAFFTYGLQWGVNNGLLKAKTYKPTIEKAWKYLSTIALQPDGGVGYVQPIGEKPDPTRIADATSQHPFGTGAWLLAACEYYKSLKK